MEENTKDLYAFDLIHPALQLGYFAAILIFTMAVIQPVYLAISLIGALAFSVYAKGYRKALRSLAWILPLILIVALANFFFTSVGSTILFKIGVRAFYLESLYFGICMGMMLAAIITWFSNASLVLSSDKIMAVLGNTLPTISLMMSMTLRLVPQFVSRGKQISDNMDACSSAQAGTVKDVTASRVRLTSVLMGWSMEDSLETADSMRARGWNATSKRTTYQRYHFKMRDAISAGVLIVLVAINVYLAWIGVSQFQFYPKMSDLVFWWGYIPFAVLAFLPLIVCLVDESRWRD